MMFESPCLVLFLRQRHLLQSPYNGIFQAADL